MGTFFASMAANPKVLRKAQAEIDSVTNGDRLPAFEDKDSLPYINAISLEVLRYNTVAPLGKSYFFTLFFFQIREDSCRDSASGG